MEAPRPNAGLLNTEALPAQKVAAAQRVASASKELVRRFGARVRELGGEGLEGIDVKVPTRLLEGLKADIGIAGGVIDTRPASDFAPDEVGSQLGGAEPTRVGEAVGGPYYQDEAELLFKGEPGFKRS